MKLKDRIAVVTGAGSGFGEGIARHFAALGARVIVADINADGANRVAAAIAASGGSAEAAHIDVTRDADVARMIGLAVGRHGRLDILVARHAVPVFRRQQHGVIVNIASTAGVRPRPGLTWYNGSKGAAVILTKSMAVELAPDNIRVNAINPVMGETGMLKDFLPGEDTPAVRQKIIGTIPLGRLSRPLDIAKACAFLASDEAEFITGVCLEVDGGRCV